MGVEIHKMSAPGGLLFNPKAYAAFDFAEEGFSGANPYFFTHGPGGCDTSKLEPYPVTLLWHWTGLGVF
jgi:hypothetical protein